MLHNVDKNSPNRDSPKPNTHDTIEDQIGRMAHGTNSVNYISPGVDPSGLSQLLGGNARLVAAGVADVSVPATNSGVLTLTTTTVPHNLGFSPIALAYLNNAQINGGGSYNLALPYPVEIGANTGGTGGAPEYLGITRQIQYSTDGTNFYILTISAGNSTATTYKVTYYLYQQTAKQ